MTSNTGNRPSPKKNNSGPAKILLSVTSLAAVLGGWAGFTLKQEQVNNPGAAKTDNSLTYAYLDLPPLPTLIAPPGSTNQPAGPVITAVPRPVVVANQGRRESNQNDRQQGGAPVASTSSS